MPGRQEAPGRYRFVVQDLPLVDSLFFDTIGRDGDFFVAEEIHSVGLLAIPGDLQGIVIVDVAIGRGSAVCRSFGGCASAGGKHVQREGGRQHQHCQKEGQDAVMEFLEELLHGGVPSFL